MALDRVPSFDLEPAAPLVLGDRFRALIENATDAIVVLDASGHCLYTSPAFTRILGHGAADVLGKSIFELMPPEDGASAAGDLTRLAHTARETIVREYRGRHQDGHDVWLHIVATNLLHEPDVRGVVCNFRDVSEPRAAEARDRLLFQLSPQPLVVYDARTLAFIDVNEAAVRHFGWSRHELLGMTVRDTMLAEDVPLLLDWLPRFATGEELATVGRHYRKDGSILNVEITSHVITLRGRRARLASLRDTTEQTRALAKLRQAQKMEAIALLAGGVAHDFNNLLGVILTCVDTAGVSLAEGHPAREDLAGIQDAANRAAQLTRKLLSLSRKQALNVQALDLNTSVDGFARLLRRVVGEDVAVEIDKSPSAQVVLADALQIEQVLLNLAANARQAMPAGGTLHIVTRRVARADGEYAELSMRDTGHGMSEDTRARVFEPFFTTKDQGTGLGLSVVYGIVQRPKGQIEIESAPDKGTTVRVMLPIAREHAARGGTPNAPAPETRGTETILVAEDEPLLRELVCSTLRGLGYTVLAAADGAEAVATFEQHRSEIALVLLDVVMPKLGARDAYAKMRALSPGLPAIFVTGYDALSPEDDAPVLQKPMSSHALATVVRTALGAARTSVPA